MAVDRGTPAYVGAPVARKEDPKLLTGQGRFVDDLTLPGHGLDGRRAQPATRTRGSAASTVTKALAGRGRGRRVLRRRPRRRLAGAACVCAWPVTEDIKMPAALAARPGQGAPRGRRGRGRDRRDAARSRRTRRSSVEVDYEPLPAVTDVGRPLADGAPLVHDDFGTNSATTWALERRRRRPRSSPRRP